MEIQKVGINQLPLLERAAWEFYASSKYLKDFDMGMFTSAWTKLLESDTGAIFMFVDEPGQVQGAIGGVVYPDLYSPTMVATEFFWYVREGHRGAGLQLYYKFEEWAKEKKANQIRMTHLCDLMPDGLKWLYGELGFEPIEINYAKELKQ